MYLKVHRDPDNKVKANHYRIGYEYCLLLDLVQE